MIEVTRTIHSVGQGLFCHESFYRDGKQCLNIVYDCGAFSISSSFQNKLMRDYLGAPFIADEKLPAIAKNEYNLLSHSIEQTFAPNQVIDIAFISHFHYDHICGIVELANKKQIKKIVMPQLSDKLLVEAIVYNYLYTRDDEINSFNSVTKFLLDVFYHKHNNDYFSIAEVSSEELQKYMVSLSADTLSISSHLPSPQDIWEYVPFCININDFADKLLKELQNDEKLSALIGKNGKKINGFANIFSKKTLLNKAIKIYQKCVQDIGVDDQNEYSMPVYSGPLVAVKRKKTICGNESVSLLNKNCSSCIKTAGCLYTGDFNARKHMISLYQFYNQLGLWEKIGVVQAPHHGSMYSHSARLYTKCTYGVISVGVLNKFKHPHWNVCSDIATEGLAHIVVNEYAQTEFKQIIFIEI